MTVIVDKERRVTLPTTCSPGDRFDLVTDSRGRIVLRQLDPAPRQIENIPVVGIEQRGKLLVGATPPENAPDYAALMRLERNEQ